MKGSTDTPITDDGTFVDTTAMGPMCARWKIRVEFVFRRELAIKRAQYKANKTGRPNLVVSSSAHMMGPGDAYVKTGHAKTYVLYYLAVPMEGWTGPPAHCMAACLFGILAKNEGREHCAHFAVTLSQFRVLSKDTEAIKAFIEDAKYDDPWTYRYGDVLEPRRQRDRAAVRGLIKFVEAHYSDVDITGAAMSPLQDPYDFTRP